MRLPHAIASQLWIGALTLALVGVLQLHAQPGGRGRLTGHTAIVNTAPGAAVAPMVKRTAAARWVPALNTAFQSGNSERGTAQPDAATVAELDGWVVMLAFCIALGLALPLGALEMALVRWSIRPIVARTALVVAWITPLGLAVSHGASGAALALLAAPIAALLAAVSVAPATAGALALGGGLCAALGVTGWSAASDLRLRPSRPGEVQPPRASRLVENTGEFTIQSAVREPGPSPLPAAKRVILITVDTLRPDHLSLYGYERQTSPRLDALVRQRDAVAFDRAQTAAPWTKPAVASLHTSRLPMDHGLGMGKVKRLRHERLTTLAEAFAAQGWNTAGFVTHFYASSKYDLDAGFRTFWELDFMSRSRFDRQLRIGAVSFRFIPWLEQHADERAFIYIHLFDPHWDYDPPPPYDRAFTDPRYRGPADGSWHFMKPYTSQRRLMSRPDLARCIALYDGEIEYTDSQLGRLFDGLRELDMWDETAIAVVSDHGEEFQDHQSVGHGWSLYDELLHVPLVVKLPGGVPEDWRTRIPERVRTIDVAPTLLHLAKIQVPSEFTGTTLLPLMREAGAPRDAVARTRRYGLKTTLLHEHYKLIHAREFNSKLFSLETFELYDLRNDPKEQKSLSNQRPELLARLKALLDKRVADVESDYGAAEHDADVELTDREKEALRALGYTEP